MMKKDKTRPSNKKNVFPSKLHKMLEDADALGCSAAVSWMPHGRAFIIKNGDRFLSEVAPQFFKATKLRSFERQCHLWGFRR